MATLLADPHRDWESDFVNWAKSPSTTEQTRCDNAFKAVKNAIDKSTDLKNRDTLVFVQGSYRNRVNVRQDSDVDIGVLCTDTFYYELAEGLTKESTFISPATYKFSQFKSDVERALISHFGASAVTRGNKSLKVRETSYHVDADVVPVFEFRDFYSNTGYRAGVSLIPDSGTRIENFPERLKNSWPNDPLHYENGVTKNTATNRRFKGVVRIVKKLRNAMEAAGHESAKPIPSYLIECLVWNVPDSYIAGESWVSIVRRVFSCIYLATDESGERPKWFEVDNIKFLFHPSQPWTRTLVHAFVLSAWSLIGIE